MILITSPVRLMQKTGMFWRMMMDYYKLHQVVNPSIVAFLDEVSLVEKIITAHWICYVAIILVNISPLCPVNWNKQNKTNQQKRSSLFLPGRENTTPLLFCLRVWSVVQFCATILSKGNVAVSLFHWRSCWFTTFITPWAYEGKEK